MSYPASNQSRFERRPAKATLHPRRVVGGLRLQATAAAAASSAAPVAVEPQSPAAASGWNWASSRWMRLAETHAPGDQLAEGLEYARAGQTRMLDLKPGAITARVQGRLPSAYSTSLRLPTFGLDQWEAVIAATAGQARYAASILAGELPANIEDLFAPHGLQLFPADPSDLSPSCTCPVFTGIVPAESGIAPPVQTPWCKHVCCLMYLVAERLGQHPLLIFSLRGMPDADLVERLRQQRALAGLQRTAAPGVSQPVYIPHVPRPLDRPAAAPLGESLHSFWSMPDPAALDELDMPIAPPEVSHPLLRRLGPSPFQGARFPLVGLLATCYDLISAAAIRGEESVQPD